MRRFFIEPGAISGDTGSVTEQEARHISTVLRLKSGQRLELFDGTGRVYQAEITSIGKFTVKTRIISSYRHLEHPPFLDVAQAVVKGKKMDLVIQKATELGVNNFHPLITQHGDIKSVLTDQIDRWQKISFESCKQCNRSIPLRCHPAASLEEFFTHTAPETAKIILWEDEQQGDLAQILSPSQERTLILIGPEGGFTATEVQSALSQGFIPASLGPRTLRAETAAIATIAIIQFVLGNLRRHPSVG